MKNKKVGFCQRYNIFFSFIEHFYSKIVILLPRFEVQINFLKHKYTGLKQVFVDKLPTFFANDSSKFAEETKIR